MLHIGIGTEEIHDEVIPEARCPNCKQLNTTTFTVTGKYVYLLFPAIPFKKMVNTVCSNCGLEEQEASFDTIFMAYSDTLKSETRYPVWFYFLWVVTGLVLVGKGLYFCYLQVR